MKKACKFFVGRQSEGGGWGESCKASGTGKLTPHEQSHVVQTAWACLALMEADYPDRAPIERGIRLIMDRQGMENGCRRRSRAFLLKAGTCSEFEKFSGILVDLNAA